MKNRNRRWLMAWTLASLFPHIMLYDIKAEDGSKTSKRNSSELRGIFAPRMDYEHWTPLGRSDPLKNEPTYDYVPPVLEKVHYWIDPASRKPDGPPQETQKNEILILGMSSKKPSTITSPNSRIDTYDPFMKFVEGPKFGQNYQRMSRPYYHTAQYYPVNNNFVKNEQPIPYTMLMPPPLEQEEVKPYQEILSSTTTENSNQSNMATSPSSTTISTTTTEPSVTVQYANLLYQSSSLGNPNEFKDSSYGMAAATSSQETWITPTTTQTDKIMTSGHQIRFPESYMEMQTFFPNSNGSGMNINGMHKGQVTDGDLGLGNIYVNIGKSEAQMHSPTGMEIPAVSVPPPRIPLRKPLMPMTTKTAPMGIRKPMPFQTLQTMQTMQPPPIIQPSSMALTQVTSLHKLLQKEVTKTIPTTLPITIPTTTIIATTTTTESPTITTTTSLTTDPLFKHYKQPSEPIKGPMYLIIQGHSKVKTYGPSKQLHGISVQEINQIPGGEKDRYRVKHLHEYKKEKEMPPRREGRSNKLQTLSHVVQTGLGAINVGKDVKEAMLGFSYDVRDMGDVTTERYYKGLVETENIERNVKGTTRNS